jgi:hypothetical protein
MSRYLDIMRNQVREQRIQRFFDLTVDKMLDPDEEAGA